MSSSLEEDRGEDLQRQIAQLIKEKHNLTEEKTSISRKFSRLQDYLTTLPTVKEYNDLKERVGPPSLLLLPFLLPSSSLPSSF